MDITYNGYGSNSGLITFTDVPNILKVEDYNIGSKTQVRIGVSGSWATATTSNGQWYIKIMDDTITNVINPNDATSKTFYIASDANSTCASIAKALRACPNIAANFTVESLNTGYVVLIGRDNGQLVYDGWFETNVGDSQISLDIQNSGYTPNQGAYIDVDVYSDGEYVTTLEKSFYGNSTSFNMTPVLTTLAEEGRGVEYQLKVTSYDPNASTPYTTVGTVGSNWIVNGYMCNQGQKYLELNRTLLAANYTRGEERDVDNNTILYTYFNEIPFSVYPYSSSVGSIFISYLDSAENLIYSASTTWRMTDTSKKLFDANVWLNHQEGRFFQQAFYIDINFGNIFTLRYNVIKPLKASDKAQRIYWRNSYGGVSFFDFTSQRSETRNLEVTTYQKNIFDYYDGNEKNELDKVYDNKVEYQVTLKSHLIEKDGIYIFNDLLQSSSVWTEINGEQYAIILDSVSVEETAQDNVYEATVKYKYSQHPSELV